MSPRAESQAAKESFGSIGIRARHFEGIIVKDEAPRLLQHPAPCTFGVRIVNGRAGSGRGWFPAYRDGPIAVIFSAHREDRLILQHGIDGVRTVAYGG